MSFIYVLDLCAVSVCAITATLGARSRKLDWFGVIVVCDRWHWWRNLARHLAGAITRILDIHLPRLRSDA